MSKIGVEPEDYGLNTAQLAGQNEAVLTAAERQARRDAEDEAALEEIAKVWKGRRIPDEWDPNHHPMFMTDMSPEAQKDNPYADVMTQLQGEDPPHMRAEELKKKGNAALKRGPKYYSDAIDLYTQALDCKSDQPEQNAIILSNRAAVQLLKKNWGKVIEDCSEAIKLDASNSKAYYRASKAANALSKWDKAVDFCERGLKIDADNKEMAKELATARAGIKKKEDELKAKKAAEAKKLLQESSKKRFLRKACDERGIVMGEPVYKELSRTGCEPYLDDAGLVHWPLLILYDQFDQSDFLEDVMEDCSVNDILATVLDPAGPRPDWDNDGAYVAGKVTAYFASHQCKPLAGGGAKKADAAGSDASFISSLLGGSERKGVEEEIARIAKSEWVKIDMDAPLIDTLMQPDHVLPGHPVLHIVPTGSFYERHFLSTPPDKV
mmetsp:Transcript_37270/g.72723  ORF Transcript_37270/g.72723 Transcript_37270/m.72723 type:complete len:437 (+) Transcript_37270:139-1449(+)|eukprot:CAMPEP_0173410574 /NCGR_PEP_ID=MMETSP1356-20130122/74926_1 /TAXON_ID=77927 ORGANISM="Hemiselmis virescens, Strain PCC157" /NCGR_SAMPLE_ID=MMETSP1356 /ASSEMBLY_ACC=CAM_ASM_000847 /LENGTH=436 /DNA_ID=CAMNT_0014372207 /DNA_START=57 /DNA_END=1367 /DNA_ORIENTATION=+